jgi:hypothetical protein
MRLIHSTSYQAHSANFALTEFYEDEMRRPTPHTQYPWRVCKGYSGSIAQYGRRIGP